MLKEANRLMANAYKHFVMRDFTYIFSGGLVLGSARYAYDGQLLAGLEYVTASVLTFVVFLGCAYYVGLIAQEGASFVGIMKTDSGVGVSKWIPTLDAFESKYKEEGLVRLERIIYFKHVGSALGSCAMLSAVILLIHLITDYTLIEFIAVLTLVIAAAVCLKLNRRAYRDQSSVLKPFVAEPGTGNEALSAKA